MAVTLDNLLTSPDHYLHSFDNGHALFVPMDRAAYHRSIFLDGRIEPAGSGVLRFPIDPLLRAAPQPAPTSWIFHVAHCGSTLLARALDQGRSNLILREPLALRQGGVADDPALVALAAATASKRYEPSAPTLVKANVPVNFVLPQLAQANAQGRALFIYCELRDYLLAILRSENHRLWLRRVTDQLGARLGDLANAPDVERAATLWLAQMRAFAGALDSFAVARTLNAERFFESPGTVLAAAAQLLCIQIGEQEIAEVVQGPLFATYSKNPDVSFTNFDRLARRAAAQAEITDELRAAEQWAEPRAQEIGTMLDSIRARPL
jgi:hypothetical protein